VKPVPERLRKAIDEAVRIVDEGVEYGAMGIDAPSGVGQRAADVLEASMDLMEDDARVRCLYSAALSLAGRIADAREQLGKALVFDRFSFEALAELDHPTAWRHVFLSPPWSLDHGRLPPLLFRLIQPPQGLKLASMRDGAERVVSIVAGVPPELAPKLESEPQACALDVNFATRAAGTFLALHFAFGSKDGGEIETLDGFEFPWPEGWGHRQELLIGHFLRQHRTFVVLAHPDGRVLLNRHLRFLDADVERHDRFLRRLEESRPRDTDARAMSAAVARYHEAFPQKTLQNRLAYRIRSGRTPDETPEPPTAEDTAGLATPPDGVEADGSRRTTPPDGVTAAAEDPRLRQTLADGVAAARPPEESPAGAGAAPPPERPPSAEPDPARAGLVVAGLWPWVRRERLLAVATVALPAAIAGLALAAVVVAGLAAPLTLVAGAAVGIAAGASVWWVASGRLDRDVAVHLERQIRASHGAVTRETLAEATGRKGTFLLPGRGGARMLRRVRRLLGRR
jgi:hypothetical protein